MAQVPAQERRYRARDGRFQASDESGEAARLRHRLRELSRRRDRAIERVALFPNPANARQLEAMRFEFAELEWRLAELEGAPAAPTS